MASVLLRGIEYDLSAKLRVAFLIQKANNHKPYSEVFKTIGSAPLEKQIEVIYLAFQVENPDKAKEIDQQQFLNILLDDSNLTSILELMGAVIEGIMYNGLSEEEIEEKKAKNQEAARNLKSLPGTRSSDEDIE
jgi:hypothetical protein